MIELTSRNVKLYAAKNYMNTSCLGEDEFSRDFNLMNKVDNMLSRELDGQLIRKLVNMIITYFNVFEHEAAARLLFYNTTQEAKLKTLLSVLNRFPESLIAKYQSYPIDSELLITLHKELS